MVNRNKNNSKPGSLEPGFFIESAVPSHLLFGVGLPPGVELRFVKKPDPFRYPSLFILPGREEFSPLFEGDIPVICLDGKEAGRPPAPAIRCHLNRPVTKETWEDTIALFFSRDYYSFPGGILSLEGNSLVCRGETLSLTKSESCLVKAFLQRRDRFLSLGEINVLLPGKVLKVLLSRLRTKTNNFLSKISPLRLDFYSVRGVGYYLGITVDNLWKTL